MSFPSFCQEPHRAFIAFGLAVAYLLLEYWLGKTERTKANSTLELILLAAIALGTVFLTLMKRKDPKDGTKPN